jgi:multidrug transporter EmrE-like cation transporter
VTAYIVVFLVGVLLASIGQVLMKIGATRTLARSVFASLLNPYTVVGYVLMLSSTVTSTVALKVLPLKVTVSLLPLGYIVVVLLSLAILGERMGRRRVWGMVMILIGVVLFNQGAL